MKKIAVLQSNYIPWKGVFDLINSVDEFIIYDDVQFTKNDWRNRNKIKTHTGLLWLTIPIQHTHGFQDIKDTIVANHDWCETHWKTIHQFYTKAPYFEFYAQEIEETYEECSQLDHLSLINMRFYQLINRFLSIPTPMSWSMDYDLKAIDANRRLIELCQKAGATHYLTGPSAKDYIDTKIWTKNQIEIEYFSYQGYPEYPQLFGPFEHQVSVLDLLINTGPNAPQYLLSFPDEKKRNE